MKWTHRILYKQSPNLLRFMISLLPLFQLPSSTNYCVGDLCMTFPSLHRLKASFLHLQIPSPELKNALLHIHTELDPLVSCLFKSWYSKQGNFWDTKLANWSSVNQYNHSLHPFQKWKFKMKRWLPGSRMLSYRPNVAAENPLPASCYALHTEQNCNTNQRPQNRWRKK